MTPRRAVATVLGVGLLPGAPGTWGSLAAIPLVMLLHWLGQAPLVVCATVVLFAVGYLAIRGDPKAEHEDPGEIVIDEVVGMMLALWPLSVGLTLTGAAPGIFPWPAWIAAFLLFRFFDILKPPPVRWFDRPGALWIMLDDVVAGALAAVISLVAARIAHGWY